MALGGKFPAHLQQCRISGVVRGMDPGSHLNLSRRRLLIIALGCWTGYAVIAALVLGDRLGSFDAAGLRYFRTGPDTVPWGPPVLIEVVRGWTALGGTLLLNLCGTIAVTALLLARLRRKAAVLAATMLSGWVFNTLMKSLVARPRPAIVSHLTEAAGLSFPSGHSFNSAAVYMSIALALASLSARCGVRWSMIAGAALVSALIALSRVWLGVHYPSDAIAGWLGGMAWALTAYALFYRPVRDRPVAPAPQIKAATPGELTG
jgi:undecaprenyl-diphosphatase